MSNTPQNPQTEKSNYSNPNAAEVKKTDKKDEVLTTKPAGSAKDEACSTSSNKIKSSSM